MPAREPLWGGDLGQARWVHRPGSDGWLCTEGWPAGRQPWAPARASEVAVSVPLVFVQLPGAAGSTLPVPRLSPCPRWRHGWPGTRRERPGSCLPLPRCLPSASPSKRGDPGASFCPVCHVPRSLPKREPRCSQGGRGGGRVTCCEQHFCPAPSRWDRKLAVLGNLSSYCGLRLSGASKETEEGHGCKDGQSRHACVPCRGCRYPLCPLPGSRFQPCPPLAVAFNVSWGRRGHVAAFPLAISFPLP